MNKKLMSVLFTLMLTVGASAFAMIPAADLVPATTSVPGWLLHRACLLKKKADVEELLNRADTANFINQVNNGITALDFISNRYLNSGLALDLEILDLLQVHGGDETVNIAVQVHVTAPNLAPVPVIHPPHHGMHHGGHHGHHGWGKHHGKAHKHLAILNEDPSTTTQPGKFLRIACLTGNQAKVEAVLQRADVAAFINEIGKRGKTALGIATQIGHAAIKQLLIAAGAVAQPVILIAHPHHVGGGHHHKYGKHGHGHGCRGGHKKWH